MTVLHVAIIGAGPASFYAVEELLKQTDLQVTVDLFDRLPTPYGLVRSGVAPDHQKLKAVTRQYKKLLNEQAFVSSGMSVSAKISRLMRCSHTITMCSFPLARSPIDEWESW